MTASLTTFASFAVTALVYDYAQAESTRAYLPKVDALLCSGFILLGSSLQQHVLPLNGQAIEVLKWKNFNHTELLGALLQSVQLVTKFCAIDRLGAGRCIAIFLPIEGLTRAHRGGFIAPSLKINVVFVVTLAVSVFSDIIAEPVNNGISPIMIGYGMIGISLLATTASLPVLNEVGSMSSLAGISVLTLGAISWISGAGTLTTSPLIILLTGISGICSMSWSALQPKAISTALRISWPIIVLASSAFSFVVLQPMTFSQGLSLLLLYYALHSTVKSSAIANSAQTAANVIVTGHFSTKLGGYYVKEIMKDKESRDIFYFLMLNLSFMVVQMLYGVWTNSLGLISDSIHMFFDCLALAVGLVAAVMSKWPASRSHPFGFAKVEIISGFANGVFLVLISISIMIEALERLMEPPEMKTDQLLLVSTLGLCVNLVGIFAFNHGHHHGHSHGHGSHHSDKDKTPEPLPTILTPRPNRRDGAFDHAMGLKSPIPDFSGFVDSDNTPRNTSFGLGLLEATSATIDNDIILRPNSDNWPRIAPNRARSPIRRPGSPLKLAIEPSMADLTEVNENSPGRESIRRDSTAEMTHVHCPETSLNHVHDHSGEHKNEWNHSFGSVHSHERGHHEGHSHALVEAGNSIGHASTPSSEHHHGHSHEHHHEHACHHGHDHSHNMEGIFLHILADTLGSAGVIVSTLLIRYFGWTGFDPLASIFIAVLIFLSVIPLLKSSFRDLLLTLQDGQEYTIREALGDVSLISGVGGVPFVRFWIDGEQKLHGIVTITAGIDGDTDIVRQKVKRKLHDRVKELADVIVQVDRSD